MQLYTYIYTHIIYIYIPIFRHKSPKSNRGQRYCCIPGCHDTTSTVLTGHQVSLHRIPANPDKRGIWIHAMRTVRQNLTINDNTRVCSAHFSNYNATEMSYPSVFPSKPPKSAPKPRHPKDRTLLVDSATNVLPSSIDEEVPDVAPPAVPPSFSSHHPTSDTPEVATLASDVGIQCTPNTSDSSTHAIFSDITLDDLKTDE